MNIGRNSAPVYVAVTGGAILIGLILFAPWPLTVSLGTVTALGTGLLLLAWPTGRRHARTPRTEPMFGEAAAGPAVNIRRSRVTDLPLPTDRPDYHFLFSAVVIWAPTPAVTDESAINAAALAVDAVVKRAREITESRDPSHAALVRHELAGALGEMRTDSTGRLRTMAESVQLVLPAHDQERLDKLAAVRKEEAVWEHERKYELSKRDYLGDDVLKDPGSAVVWWLARNDYEVERTVKDIGLLAQLSSAANNGDVPEALQSFTSTFASPNGHPSPDGSASWPPGHEDSPGDRFEAFLQAIRLSEDDPQRRLFARQVADCATMHGWQDLAEELRTRYDMPAEAEAEDEPVEEG